VLFAFAVADESAVFIEQDESLLDVRHPLACHPCNLVLVVRGGHFPDRRAMCATSGQ